MKHLKYRQAATLFTLNASNIPYQMQKSRTKLENVESS
jgi:hypothetical protein